MTGSISPGPVWPPYTGKGDPGASSRCARIDQALADDIRENPKGFYVNVHNARFPAGAVRGQITDGG